MDKTGPLDNHCQKRILLLDNNEAFGQLLKNVLSSDYPLDYARDVEKAISILARGDTDVVLFNWDQFGDSGGTAASDKPLQQIADTDGAPPVIVFSWDERHKTAMEATRQGAVDFFVQPFSVLELKFAIVREQRRMALMRELQAARQFLATMPVDGLLGHSREMDHVRAMIRKVAGVSTTVLVTGESGTGKEVVARAIHRLGQRGDKPFVAFSASALPESLIEDELFGHHKGAFTGAFQGRAGWFEAAQGGTLLIDEIGDLALPLQSKLLRVLQERSLTRLGSNASVALDLRVICATHRDLKRMVREGTFRSDLYFRISALEIHLPPLRDRVDDIALLTEHFTRMFASNHGKHVKGLTTGALSALGRYGWPGNVRELQNVIERSVVLADGPQLGINDLPLEIRGAAPEEDGWRGSFHEAVQSFKREIVRSALRAHGGNKLKAALELRISRCYLHRLVNQLNIREEGPEAQGEAECSDEASLTVPAERAMI